MSSTTFPASRPNSVWVGASKRLKEAASRIQRAARSRRDVGQGASVTRDASRFWDLLNLEIERARRHERRFALTRLSFEGPVTAEVIMSALSELRLGDAVATLDERPMILWTDTDGTGVVNALQRVGQRFPRSAGAVARTVVYPVHGYSQDALFDELERAEGVALDPSVGGRDRARDWISDRGA